MLIAFLVVLGIFSFQRLGVDLFPRSDPATVYISAQLPGATPEELTSQVILPLEEAVAAVSGIDEMRAVVTEGNGNVIVTFVLEKDIAQATEDVREKVAGVIRNLPPNLLPPVIQKADPDSDPVITLVLSGQRTPRELSEIADKQIRRALETVDGVASISVSGGQNRQINVFLDINKLSGYSLTAQDVQSALRNENVEAPGGRIVRGASEMGVRTLGRVDRVEDFNGMIVKNASGSPIRLRDVGHVEDGMAEKRSFAQYKGSPAIIMEVRRQTGVNTVQTVEGIKKRLVTLATELPPGTHIDAIKDQAVYIKASVAALEEHLVLGSLFAALIVWLFIRDWRTVLISSVAIPTSIITTFTLLKAMDFTLNSMTLLGLTLAVGIVIDDAIIVLENIYRFIEEKDMPPLEAAVKATREIALAVVATTVSLVIIFVPIAFMTGYARRFVNQFGWTMAFAIVVSMLVAFTLTPALSARLLKKKTGAKAAKAHESNGLFDRAYIAVLGWSLNHRFAIVLLCLAVFGSTFIINRYVGRDWMPQEDQAMLGVSTEMPEGYSLEATEKTAVEIGRRIQQNVPEVTAVIPASMGFLNRVTMSDMTLLLKDPSERGSITEVAAKVRQITSQYPQTRPRINFPNSLGGRDAFAPIRGQLLGPDVRVLARIAKDLAQKMQKTASIVDVKANINLSDPELQIAIDRAKASDLGVRVADVSGAVRLLMSGEDQISTYKEGPEQYPVMVRLMPGQRDDPEVLSRLLIPSAKLGLIRLDSVANLNRGLGPSRIDRYNRQFSVGLYGNVAPGHSLQEAADDTAELTKTLNLPPGYSMKMSGQVKVLEETTTNMILAIGLASIFMYMVLAAQFESLVQPAIIMLTLPLSIPFALISLIATGRTLNLFSALGILLLLGIVKKNGILQIDYMNHLRGLGHPMRYVILEANRVRLRPILMTTFSIVAGLIPTAIGLGAGASQRSAIAVTIIGGQTLCLALSLLVVPVGYSFVEDAKALLAKRREKITTPHTLPA